MLGKDKPRVVVVDDEQYICNIIAESLADEDYDVVTLNDPMRAMEHIASNPVDLVLTDLVMGEHSGVQVVERTLEYHDDAIIVLMTAHPTVQTAISVLKRGAYDFLVKPFKLELLRASIKRGLAHQKALRDNLRLRGQVEFLKVANAAPPGVDLDTYLQMVLRSCITELSAAAAAIIGVSPDTSKVTRRICQTDNSIFRDELLDNRHVEEILQKKSRKPTIKSDRVTIDGKEVRKVFVSHPILRRSRIVGLINVLITSRFERLSRGRLDVLTILANSAASAMANEQLYQERQTSYLEAIRGLANAIEARDAYTAGHTDRVTRLAELIAAELGWDSQRIDDLVMGCMLHDIGKIGVPDSILSKPDRLTEAERKKMKEHPRLGLRIVKGIRLFKAAIPYIIAHHERFDGDGYPKGLKGQDIPVEGRLLAVADTFDAIMSDRPYRSGADLQTAVRELEQHKGSQFDPELVDVLVAVLKQGKVDLKQLYGYDGLPGGLDTLDATEKVSV
ncbi:MAG: response regulator [Candidatus Zixiibacteriota bacterium]|nr:MAG: response regulator [candidate division Zixibacteria bacterium]